MVELLPPDGMSTFFLFIGSTLTMEKAYLILADGTVFTGSPIGATGSTIGETVFTTGMTGYL